SRVNARGIAFRRSSGVVLVSESESDKMQRPNRKSEKSSFGRRSSGFTLIELLVVISIIAVLIGILLPSLTAARMQGQAMKCAANMHDVATAMSGYLSDWNGTYPPAYIYPDSEGNYDFFDQNAAHPFGYIHWSWFLYSNGQVQDKSFQCPTY